VQLFFTFFFTTHTSNNYDIQQNIIILRYN